MYINLSTVFLTVFSIVFSFFFLQNYLIKFQIRYIAERRGFSDFFIMFFSYLFSYTFCFMARLGLIYQLARNKIDLICIYLLRYRNIHISRRLTMPTAKLFGLLSFERKQIFIINSPVNPTLHRHHYWCSIYAFHQPLELQQLLPQ